MNKTKHDLLTGEGARTLVKRMGEAVVNFLAALTTDQRAKATFRFEDQAERTRWHYTPIPRHGLPLAEMTRPQQRLAQQVVATGLSRGGYVTASTIMGLETTLDFLEGWKFEGPGRDPVQYYLSIFGEPDAKTLWGWRFEGHHISLHYTIAGGRIIAPTPTFFGSNPAEAPLGAVGTLRPLMAEEDLARELLHTLDESQQQHALLATIAPNDIITTNQPQIIPGLLPASIAERMGLELAEALRYSTEPKGLAATALQDSQREILTALISQYIRRMPDEIAEVEMAKLATARFDQMHFAWAGGFEHGQPHYYRIQGADLLIEYDNTQNNANHIHSVWRDPADDFGASLLAQHYAHAH